MSASSAETRTIKHSKIPLYISVAIIVVIVLSYYLFPGVKQFFVQAWQVLTSNDQQRINDWLDQFGFWGPVLIVFAMVLQMFLLIIPTPLLMIVATLAYGSVWGTVIVLVAVYCASTVGYWIGAYLGAPVVSRLLGTKAEHKVESFLKDYGFWAVIITRVSPFLSNDAISFVGGILRMGYWRFIGATLVGIFPLTLLIAYLGEEIDSLQKALIWISIISILFFVLYVWWDRKRRKARR